LEKWNDGFQKGKRSPVLANFLLRYYPIIPVLQYSMTPRNSGIVRRWTRK
jgi:hypothetical protein